MRDLRLATLAMLALTAVLGALLPASVSYATDTEVTDHPALPLAKDAVRPVRTATAVISGCPNLPKDGNTLVYRLAFADGSESNLGAWRPLAESPVAALEAIAARLPEGTARERFANPIGSDPLAADCLEAFGGEAGANGIARLPASGKPLSERIARHRLIVMSTQAELRQEDPGTMSSEMKASCEILIRSSAALAAVKSIDTGSAVGSWLRRRLSFWSGSSSRLPPIETAFHRRSRPPTARPVHFVTQHYRDSTALGPQCCSLRCASAVSA